MTKIRTQYHFSILQYCLITYLADQSNKNIMDFNEKELELLKELKKKHESRGENFAAHLEGSLYKDYINYWDYVGIDALLNLQKPETKYSDEMTFIIYHQISELFFKLIIHELEQIGYNQKLKVDFFIEKMSRINSYFSYLEQSFKVLSIGMEKEQFMKFRTALTPASGFQSIQFRLIELWSTKFRYLITNHYRNQFTDGSSVEQMYPYIYWKAGATDMQTGQKKLTLIQFEDKYSKLILRKGNEFQTTNLCYKYLELNKKDQDNPELISALKLYDQHVNVIWPLTHYNNANTYLVTGDKVASSTGGTNWKQYLPPWFQKQSFFPMIWSEKEMEEWGKAFSDARLL